MTETPDLRGASPLGTYTSPGARLLKAVNDRALANGAEPIVEQPTPELVAERAAAAKRGSTADCQGCGQKLSYHDGSGQWNHVNTWSAVRCDGPKVPVEGTVAEPGALSPAVPAAAYEKGAVWYTSWGYDQTNVDFFEVVGETAKSITLRRIGSESVDRGSGSCAVSPARGRYIVDFGLHGNPGTETRRVDDERGYSEKRCVKPKVSKNGYASESVKIDNVRVAWFWGDRDSTYETAPGWGH